MPELSNYAICYEGIQRVYRNAVVERARQVLREQYPRNWGDEVRRLYGNQWQQIEEEAEEGRVVGRMSSPLEDELDYLGVNHFYNLFQKFFDVLFPSSPRTPERTRQQEREAVLNWAKELRDLRNPISHPAKDDLRFNDAFRGMDAAQRILRKIDNAAAEQVEQLLRLLDGGQPTADSRPRLPAHTVRRRGPGRVNEDDVLVVPANRFAREDYYTYGAYICQANRPFRQVQRMAFYYGGRILRHVPAVLGVAESITFTNQGLQEIRESPLDPSLANRAADLLSALLREKEYGRRVGVERVKFMLLSSEDSSDTHRLPHEIVNDKRGRRGQIVAFVQGQRYISFAKLQEGPATTSQLE